MRIDGAPLSDNDKISRRRCEFMPVLAKLFPHDTFETIAHDSFAYSPRHDETDTMMGRGGRVRIHNSCAAAAGMTVVKHRFEFTAFFQPAVWRKLGAAHFL